MKKPDEPHPEKSVLRDKIIGLGEQSFRKSYFPQLQAQLHRLEQFRALFDKTRDGLYIIDCAADRVVDANIAGATFLEAELPNLLQHPFSDFFAGPEKNLIERAVSGMNAPPGETHTFTVPKTSIDGKAVHLEFTINVVVLQGKRFLVVVARDVTERRLAEERMVASLKEKEALLKEIHHRVKNNLQVISSLLSIQAHESKDPQIIAALRESQARVKSMALVHERLYQSADFSGIDFHAYLPAVARDLLRSYERSDIALTITADEIFLPIESAIPCGLIVSELLSNSLKHGFPDGKKGEIAVSLQRRESGIVRIVVSDNGVGFPEGQDFRTMKSTGMALILGLAQQVDGTIELERSDWTRFILTFPVSSY